MEVAYADARPLSDPEARYSPLNPRREVLPAGYRKSRGALPLPSVIVIDRDVAIPLRDGTTIYADVFRPETDEQIPAIVSWAPYGKGGTGFWDLDNPVFPRRFGVPKKALSGLQSWESPDPAYWCHHGYAIVQIDARGAFNSEGDIRYLGAGEGEDGFDAVEHLAKLPWCSGKVGLAGNSWLSMSQWHTAAQNPPHLAAIAPWEGSTDLFHDVMVRGGIPRPEFPAAVRDKMYGRNRVEDPVAMLTEHPLFDTYWASKVADLCSIDVPAYVVASYTNNVHSYGTFRGWKALSGPKWLRVHNSHEWPDFYLPERVDELRRFFDRYLRDVDNGWENTPAVRYSVLDPGGADTVDRPADTFPPTGVADLALYLDTSSGQLQEAAPNRAVAASYSLAGGKDSVVFTHTFDTDTEIVGFPLLELWASAEGADDMDIYAYLCKRDRKGRRVQHQILDLGLPLGRKWMPIAYRAGAKAMGSAFYPGMDGRIRATRRGLEADSVVNGMPMLAIEQTTPLPEQGPVKLEIPFWPGAMRWRAGEKLELILSGSSLRPPELPDLPEAAPQQGTAHTFHSGPDLQSKLILPVLRK